MLLFFALAMAIATFIENDYGTPVAKALVYESWWFELVMVILMLNFIGNIARYRLFRREKWPVLVFHLAFILIFIGGAITRYISFEGAMHIREGSSSDEIVSDGSFLKVQIAKGEQALAYDDVKANFIPKDVPGYLSIFRKSFKSQYDFMGQLVTVRLLDVVPRAQDSLIAQPNGKQILHLVTLVGGNRENKFIPSGTTQLIENTLVSYNNQTAGAVNLSDTDGPLKISSPLEGNFMIMATQIRGVLAKSDVAVPLNLRSLYTIGNLVFVVPQPPSPGEVKAFPGDKTKNEHDPDQIIMEISTANTVDTVNFRGGKGLTGFQHQAAIDGLTVSLGYGSKIYHAPFRIQLDKFLLEKYPGSNSPASYSSDVTLLDGSTTKPYKIFMNNILDHKGYRFFQSSYDGDEKGTILSVNHDFWGTTITYIGYTLLFLAMFVTLFWKGSRFSDLNQKLKKLARSRAVILVLLMGFGTCAFGQKIDMHGPSEESGAMHNHAADSGLNHVHTAPQTNTETTPNIAGAPTSSTHIDRDHADEFGSLMVQNVDGRFEPVNTMALDILRRIYGKDEFSGLTANQFLLSAMIEPVNWAQLPIIKVSGKGGKELSTIVGANEQGYTTLFNLYEMGSDGNAHFRLEREYMQAFAKKASEQNSFDKEVIELNDKLQAMQVLMSGQYMRVMPIPNDPNHKWAAIAENRSFREAGMDDPMSLYLKQVAAGNWKEAKIELDKLKNIQQKLGGDVIPSAAKINWEISYNSWNVFFKLMITYSILGTIILFLAFIKLFRDTKLLKNLIRVCFVLLCIAAAIQAFGLGIRWYISGHEPWSNGYEAVMFISWIGVLSGMFQYRNSNAFIPAAGCLIAVILMGFAHGGSQMNPQITPLVPVLKSYWLMIHVAIITASYGFFGLGALIGMVVMLLYIVGNKKISKKVAESINELTIVNEMSLTIGLFLLTVGTFLGGIWANESWGRYWGWDPKETWAFISVFVYAFVLHVRLIPKMQGKYLFNLLALLSFSSVIMTYFGVNYYLSGLHSYAKGDPVPVPSWVYITTAVILLTAALAYWRKSKITKA